jgi:vitamin B12 transporter
MGSGSRRRGSRSRPGVPGGNLFGGAALAAALWCLSAVVGWEVASPQERPIPLDTLEVQVGSRVSSRLPVLTRSVQVLGREEIDLLPVRTLAGLLEWATGVEVLARSPAQSDLSLRGAGFEQVLVLVDGVRMSDPQTGHHDLNLAVPLDRVERVEILRGPASALHGADAVGGVVNVVTRQGEVGPRGRVEGGSWGTGRMSASTGLGGMDGRSLRMGGELSRSDGHREGTDHEMALLHAGASLPLGEGNLSGSMGLARRDFGAQDFYAPYPSFERTRTYTGSLRWAGNRPAGVVLETGASFRRHTDDFTLIRDAPEIYRNRHASTQAGGDLSARWIAPGGVDLALGGELFRDRLQSNALGHRAEGRGAVFGEAVLGWGDVRMLALGLRGDWHESFGTFVSPSISGSWRAGAAFRARAAVGRSFRAPTWTERYYMDPVHVGRDDLEPERAWSGEVGADVFLGSAVRFSLTGFVRRAEDLIDWARPEDEGAELPWETRNVSRATFRGIEADLTAPGPWGVGIMAGAALLSLRSEEATGYRSKYALRPLREQFTLGLERGLGGRASLGLHGLRGTRAGEEPFHRLDVRASVRQGAARLYLDAVNLLDASYPDVTGARAPGRALFVGLEVGRGR